MYLSKRAVQLVILLVVSTVMTFSAVEVAAQGRLEPREDDEVFSGHDEDAEVEKEADDSSDSEMDDFDERELPVPVLFGISRDDIYPSFGDPRGGGDRSHEGLDILAPAGTPIVSPIRAEVRRIGRFGGAGKFIILETDDERELRFYHLEDQADYLDEGDDLQVGDLLGFVGSSGNALASVPHLHLEIRDDGDLRDPFKIVTVDFSLEEKIDILDELLNDVSEEENLAEFLADEFSATFRRAERSGHDIPEAILAQLPDDFAELDPPRSDLTIGSLGADVRSLQQILIDAGALTRVNTPTGYFGPITKGALEAYQQEIGITPASGIYGPKTRAYLSTGQNTSPDLDNAVELRERILQLKQRVEEIKATLGN